MFCKLWYVCQVLPLPIKIAAKFESLVRKFIWTGKLEKLALDEIKISREEGGLNVVCIRCRCIIPQTDMQAACKFSV